MNKQKRNDEIQIEADNLLEIKFMKLFHDNGFEFKQHESSQKKEKGIDYYCHVYDRDNQTQVLFFETQNKGTNTPVKIITSPKHDEKGKISFQLELRHAKQYYYELTEPLIFIYTDITTQISYWYSIQLDSALENRINSNTNSKGNKTKIQIYIPAENIIGQDNFERLIKEIRLSRECQHSKHNFKLEITADYNFIKDIVKDKNIIDKAIFTIDLFEGINVIPTNIISKLYPFKGSQQHTYVWDSNLKTDNEEFYDFMNSIEKNGDKLILKGNEYDKTTSDKIDKIVKFFRVNCIEHISWYGNSTKENNRVCVHKLHLVRTCNCERCNYDRLDFVEATKMLDVESNDYTLHEKLRRGYTSSSMGKFSLAIKCFQEVDREATKSKKVIFSTIAKYNLVKLRSIISNSYLEPNRNALLNILEKENIEIKEATIKIEAPHFYDLYKWIKDEKFFERALWNIDSKLEEIKKMSFNDKLGAFYSNDYDQNLLFSFLRLYYFLEFNLIIYNRFFEYKQLTKKVLEGLFALYTIKNPNTSRLKKFDSIILKMWMFNVRFEDANHLLKQYNIHKIKVYNKQNTFDDFNAYLENLHNSLGIIEDEENDTLQDNIEIIISNITLIISRIKFKEDQLNDLISKLFLVIEKLDKRGLIPTGALLQLFSHHKNINPENIKKIILVLKKHHFQYASVFSYAVKYYAEKSSSEEIKNFLFKLLNTNEFSEEILFSDENKFETLGYIVSFLDSETREKIKYIITTRLRVKFDASFYQLSSIFDLIDYDEELFNLFVLSVPDLTKRDPALESIFRQKENYRLDQLINLIYKYNIPFTDEIKKLSSYASKKDYYDWLMDIDGFDYSKFNPYWVLEYKVKYYLKTFKKSMTLKKELKKGLKKDYIEGVAKIYIELYN